MSESHPVYHPNWTPVSGHPHLPSLARLIAEVPWLRVTETRSECFMADTPVSYTYGKGIGERTYTSVPFGAGVSVLLGAVNAQLCNAWAGLNVCFLNRYDTEREHLGWHADDHAGTDHTKPIVVVSFGQAREIWWRPTGLPGEVPPQRRRLLEDGSFFLMPPGFQSDYQHRIPKGDRPMGTRISLTFRAFLPADIEGDNDGA